MRLTRRGRMLAWVLLVVAALAFGLAWPYVWIGA
jgi:hypothetical protein